MCPQRQQLGEIDKVDVKANASQAHKARSGSTPNHYRLSREYQTLISTASERLGFRRGSAPGAESRHPCASAPRGEARCDGDNKIRHCFPRADIM